MRLLPTSSVFVIIGLLVLAGCKEKSPEAAKEPTRAMRAEAALLISEAEFAIQLRDHARAEPLIAKAVGIIADDPDQWIMLGTTRRKLGQTEGARKAYREALAVLERDYKKSPAAGELILQQVYVHALLGQADEARALLEKAGKAHPSDQQVQDFIRSKSLDRLLNDRAFKEIAL